MKAKTKEALLGRGIPSNLVQAVGANGHTVSVLTAMSKVALAKYYSEEEVALLADRLKRHPIPQDDLGEVLSRSKGVCCICADGQSSRPYQIHHIKPYSVSSDHSVNNLALVCPTHHQAIHQESRSPDRQRELRAAWYSLASLVGEFEHRGIPFPFGAFEGISFEANSDPTEILSCLGVVSPSTSRDLVPSHLVHQVCGAIDEHGFALVGGLSGSGKSTLAMAVGGEYAREGYRVIRYRSGLHSSAQEEVQRCMGVAVRPTIIVLDDVNRVMDRDAFHALAKASSKTVRLLGIWTTEGANWSEPGLSARLHMLRVTWDDLKPRLLEILDENEAAYLELLPKQDRFGHQHVGGGYLDVSLVERAQRLQGETETVSQFLYLLRSGAEVSQAIIRELVEQGRSDTPILYAAIEQIAGFEKPVTADETAEALTQSLGVHTPAVWTQECLEAQAKKGVLRQVRNGFTTIHRDWAVSFIAAALVDPSAGESTSMILRRSFGDVSQIDFVRLHRIWSWIWSTSAGRSFVEVWARSLTEADWILLVGRAAESGLTELGFLLGRMHMLFSTTTWNKTAASAFRKSKDRVIRAVINASPEDWYWVSQVTMAIGYVSPEVYDELISLWEPRAVADLIQKAPPHLYERVPWCFTEARERHAAWCKRVGQQISPTTVIERLNSVPQGDIRTIHEAFGVLRTFGVPAMRSTLRRFVAACQNTLTGASLNELQPVIVTELQLILHVYPDDVEKMLSVVDHKAMAAELTTSIPRTWFRAGGLFSFACGDAVTKIVGHLDIDALAQNVAKYIPRYRYELRVLLWLLSKSEVRTDDLATSLYPSALTACAQADSESSSIVSAFTALDAQAGARLQSEAGIALTAKSEGSVSMTQSIEQLRKLDASGVDYDVYAVEADE